jgi:hypothetical protein
MAKDIRVKFATSRTDLKDLLNRIAPDDPRFRVVVDRMADATAGVRYVVIWEKGDVEEANS